MDKKPKNEFNTRPRRMSRASGKGNEADSDECGQIDDIIGGFGKYQFMIFMFKILIGLVVCQDIRYNGTSQDKS